MQDAWVIVGVVLLAVLVGAAVPVLFQLFSTLRVARGLLLRLGPKLDGTLTEVREAGRRMNRIGSELEASVKRAKLLLDVAGDLGEAMRGLRDSLKMASALTAALGPALAAAVRALTERVSGDGGVESPPTTGSAEPSPGPAEHTAGDLADAGEPAPEDEGAREEGERS